MENLTMEVVCIMPLWWYGPKQMHVAYFCCDRVLQTCSCGMIHVLLRGVHLCVLTSVYSTAAEHSLNVWRNNTRSARLHMHTKHTFGKQ